MPAASAGCASALDDGFLAATFSSFVGRRKVVLAVSGGPDSTALMLLADSWRRAAQQAPELVVASVDHGIRPQSRGEAELVGGIAEQLGLRHDILDLPNALPSKAVQEAARHARYEALLAHARRVGADAIATAHTMDDQAETVLFRLIRGSGLTGLAGIPVERALEEISLLRPLLSWRKTALIALCEAKGVAFVRDPSNSDPRFARTRMRALLPLLAEEGLDAGRMSRLAERVVRAEQALEHSVDAASAELWEGGDVVSFSREGLLRLPAEIGLRLLARAVEQVGEGSPELAKLEALLPWARAIPNEQSGARTIAETVIRVRREKISISKAPARRGGKRL